MNKHIYKYSGSIYGRPLPSEYTGVLARDYISPTRINSKVKNSQEGGKNKNLDYIIDPKTNRSVYLFSKKGKELLLNYLKLSDE